MPPSAHGSEHSAHCGSHSSLRGALYNLGHEVARNTIKDILLARGKDLGGMFNKPKDMPVLAWLYYVQVVDLDAAIARAKEKGAKLCNGPMTVPTGARIAQLADPQGAMFAIHENPKS